MIYLMENLDSKVFFEIRREDLDIPRYIFFIDTTLRTWLVNEGNAEYDFKSFGSWNEEGGISGRINGQYTWSKLYRLDERNYIIQGRRGVLIRDHYSPSDVIKIHFISDNFERFLSSQGIEFKRQNYNRP